MTAPAAVARHDLAAALVAAAVPDVTVYSSPPETMTSPSYVLAPGRPYIEPGRYCARQARLRLVVTVPRAAGVGGLDYLDELLETARGVLAAAGADFGDVTNVGITQYVGGTEHLTAIADLTVPLAASVQRNTPPAAAEVAAPMQSEA